MSGPWLSIVGIGDDGLPGLSAAARRLIGQADLLIGGARHLALIPPGDAERLPWATPFADSLALLRARTGSRVCALVSGDPMWFGAGATLSRYFDPGEITILPHPGAFSLAASRVGWALQDVTCLSLHGRPVDPMVLQLWPGHRLLLLTEDGDQPALLARWLSERGYGPSRMTVLERLGGPAERRVEGLAATWTAGRTDDLNSVAVELVAEPGLPVLSRRAGLPDDAFQHDGQLTKQEVRAVTLAALAPWPGALLWDLGAGCGSIAIEWARAGGRAIAVEREAARCDLIARNAARLGVPELPVIEDDALRALAGLEGPPDVVFIGGGSSDPRLLEAGWAALPPHGRLVANAVTAEAEAALWAWSQTHGGDLTRLAVSRLSATGTFHSWRPLMPVTQYAGVKR